MIKILCVRNCDTFNFFLLCCQNYVQKANFAEIKNYCHVIDLRLLITLFRVADIRLQTKMRGRNAELCYNTCA